MNNKDFANFIQQVKNNPNPQQLVLSALNAQLGNSPMGNNLLQLAKSGNTAEIEKIARNIVASRGQDFDKEFTAFKKQWGFE